MTMADFILSVTTINLEEQVKNDHTGVLLYGRFSLHRLK